jgi:hypothetical protein
MSSSFVEGENLEYVILNSNNNIYIKFSKGADIKQ